MKNNNLLPSIIFLLGAALFLASPFIDLAPKDETLIQQYLSFDKALIEKDTTILSNSFHPKAVIQNITSKETKVLSLKEYFLNLNDREINNSKLTFSESKIAGNFGSMELNLALENKDKCHQEHLHWIKTIDGWLITSLVRREASCSN